MSSDATPSSEKPPEPAKAAEAPKADQAAAAAPTAPAATEDKKAAAAEAAKNAAKAGLDAVKGLSKGAAGKILGLVKSAASIPLLIVKGDLLTKVLMLGFLASIALVGLAGHRLYLRFISPYFQSKVANSKAGSGINQFFEAEKELAIATANLVFLDRFSANITAQGGAVQVVELELFVESDTPETAKVLKARTDEIREIVAGAIQNLSYEQLITVEGKEALKKQLLKSINAGLRRWNQSGEAKKLYFTRFVMG